MKNKLVAAASLVGKHVSGAGIAAASRLQRPFTLKRWRRRRLFAMCLHAST
jgi:hypothetical protein